MPKGRLSIAKLMAIVAIIAVNIAVARAILPDHIDILIGVALMWLTLQIGLVRVIEGRGRAFWAGFLVFGTLAMSSYIGGMLSPSNIGIAPNGAVVKTPGSPLFEIWYLYMKTSSRAFEGMVPAIGLGGVVVIGLIMIFIPQAIAAVAGGLLARRIFGRRADRPAPPPESLSQTAAASPLQRQST